MIDRYLKVCQKATAVAVNALCHFALTRMEWGRPLLRSGLNHCSVSQAGVVHLHSGLNCNWHGNLQTNA